MPWFPRCTAIALAFALLGGSGAPAHEPRAVPPAADRLRTRALARRMAQDPALPAGAIEVQVRAEVARVRGQVPHLAARERALAWARALKGVHEVVDEMEITAPFPDPPLALVEALEDQFYRSYALEPGEVEVVASEGKVTLRGTVDSIAERILVRRAAASMPGVRELEDELEVAAPPTRPDLQVSAEILALLEHDLLLPAEQLQVRVRSGVAQIEGLVPSQRAAARLVEVAAMAGARDLDLTRIRVEPALRDPALRGG